MAKIIRRPDRAEGGITEEERQQFKECVEFWTKVAYRTDPIEPDKIVPAIEGMYAAAGLKKPRVVIVSSPLAMAFAYGAAAWIWRCRKQRSGGNKARDPQEATYAATNAATRAATQAATDEATWVATSTATQAGTWAATQAATFAATYAAIDVATRVATREATSTATREATEAATFAATREATEAATEAATRVATWVATEAATCEAIETITETLTAATERALDDLTEVLTHVETSVQIHRLTEEALSGGIYEAVKRAVEDAINTAVRAAGDQLVQQALIQATGLAIDQAIYHASIEAAETAVKLATPGELDFTISHTTESTANLAIVKAVDGVTDAEMERLTVSKILPATSAVSSSIISAVHAATSEEVSKELKAAVEVATPKTTQDMVYHDTLLAADQATAKALDRPIIRDIADNILPKVYYAISNVLTAISTATTEAVHSTALKVERATKISAIIATSNAVDWSTYYSARSQTLDIVDQAIRQEVSQAIEQAIEQAATEATGLTAAEGVIHAVDQIVKKSEELNIQIVGKFDRLTRAAIDNEMDPEVRRLTTHSVHDTSTFPTSEVVFAALFLAIQKATEAAVQEATKGGVDQKGGVSEKLRKAGDAILQATDADTGNAMRQTTLQQVHNNTHNARTIANGLEQVIDKVVAEARQGALMCAKRWHVAYQGGNMWAAWCCYLSAARDVLGLRLPEYENYKYYEQAALHGSFRVLHPEFCIVSDFPEVIKINERNQPHCEDGPSHRWRDGWSLWHINGVRVTEQIVMRPETLTVQQVEEEENEEVRRVMIERMGWIRYLKESGAKCQHHRLNERDNQREGLFVLKDGRKRFVVSDPSTGRRYALGVPREIETCEEAQMWLSHGLDQFATVRT